MADDDLVFGEIRRVGGVPENLSSHEKSCKHHAQGKAYRQGARTVDENLFLVRPRVNEDRPCSTVIRQCCERSRECGVLS